MDEIIKAMEIIGIIAAVVSGSLVAIGAGMDMFGVIFVGCITAVGGGITRDLLLGITPPAIFTNFSIFSIPCLQVFWFLYWHISTESVLMYSKKK